MNYQNIEVFNLNQSTKHNLCFQVLIKNLGTEKKWKEGERVLNKFWHNKFQLPHNLKDCYKDQEVTNQPNYDVNSLYYYENSNFTNVSEAISHFKGKV